MEDLTGQLTTDAIDVTEWNNYQQEFVNLISPFLTMSNADLNQLRKVVSNYASAAQWANSTGGSVAYTLTVGANFSAPSAYQNGQTFQFRPNVSNTVGANTVNVNSLGAISIVREDGSALQAGDLHTSRDAVIRYSSTGPVFALMNWTLAAGTQDLPDGFITGMTMGRNPSEPATEFRDIAVQIGQCRDATNAANLVNSSVVVKRFDANFGFGTAAGGFGDSVAALANTWYRFFAIGRNVSGTVDYGFDRSATAANLLADANILQGDSSWVYYRQLGWVRSASTVELLPFINSPDDPNSFYWISGAGAIEYESATFGTAGIARATVALSYAPPSSVALTDWFGWNTANSGNAGIFGVVAPVGWPDVAPAIANSNVYHTSPGPNGNSSSATSTVQASFMASVPVLLDSSSQFNVRWDADASNARVYMNTKGFRFKR